MRVRAEPTRGSLTEQSLAGLVRSGELVEAEGPAVHLAPSGSEIVLGKRLLDPQLRFLQERGEQLRGGAGLVRLLGIGDQVHLDLLAEMLVIDRKSTRLNSSHDI